MQRCPTCSKAARRAAAPDAAALAAPALKEFAAAVEATLAPAAAATAVAAEPATAGGDVGPGWMPSAVLARRLARRVLLLVYRACAGFGGVTAAGAGVASLDLSATTARARAATGAEVKCSVLWHQEPTKNQEPTHNTRCYQQQPAPSPVNSRHSVVTHLVHSTTPVTRPDDGELLGRAAAPPLRPPAAALPRRGTGLTPLSAMDVCKRKRLQQ